MNGVLDVVQNTFQMHVLHDTHPEESLPEAKMEDIKVLRRQIRALLYTTLEESWTDLRNFVFGLPISDEQKEELFTRAILYAKALSAHQYER